MDAYTHIDSRINKIDEVIQRLAAVASDLSKLIAVNDQRLSQQEKNAENITHLLEKRREDLEAKVEEIYETIYKKDAETLQQIKEDIKASRIDSVLHHQRIDKKIETIQRFVWMACGGGTVIGYLISIIIAYLKVIN